MNMYIYVYVYLSICKLLDPPSFWCYKFDNNIKMSA